MKTIEQIKEALESNEEYFAGLNEEDYDEIQRIKAIEVDE